MTNIEQFENDIAFNANHILFTMTDDDFMGHRGPGFYMKHIIDKEHESRNFIFDNGHHYVVDDEEQMLYVCESISDEFFIHKYLEKIVSDFAEKWLINLPERDTFIDCSNNQVEAGWLIKLIIDRNTKIVNLTNIHIPMDLRHKGLGKALIKEVFDVCERLKYRLILLDVVDSFSDSLRKRNGVFLDYDKIEITNETILT